MLTPVYRYLFVGRSTPLVFGMLVATATYALAQAPAQPAPSETQAVARPATTVFQIEALALAAGFGSAGTGLGWGIRSATKIITDYLTKRDAQEADWKKDRHAHEEKMVGAVSAVAGRYHDDRGGVQKALDVLSGKVDDVIERLGDVEDALPAVARKAASRRAVMPHVRTSAAEDTAVQKPI